MKHFIPKSCLSYMEWPTQYHESFECNIITINMDISVPPHVDLDNFGFQLDLTHVDSIMKIEHFPSILNYQQTTLGNEYEKIIKLKLPLKSELQRIKVLKFEWKK